MSVIAFNADGEPEEDVKPLVNRRTERRRREKLLREKWRRFPVAEDNGVEAGRNAILLQIWYREKESL